MNTSTNYIGRLKKSGHRITKSRTAIIKILAHAHHLPIGTSDIFRMLERQNCQLNRTTIYRELDFLVRQGIVWPIQFIGKATRYELAQKHHHHLVCTNCHSVQDIPMTNHLAEQEKRIYRQTRFTVMSHALEFYGLCRRCEKINA